MIRPTIKSNIHPKSFGIAAATALVVALAATGASHAEYRLAGHPAHVNALPHPPMRPLQTGTGVAAPAAQAQPPRVMQSTPSVAMGHAEDSGHAGNQGHDRGHDLDQRNARIIVVGVPSDYYYGPQTYYAPGYYGDQYSDGGPATGPSPLGDTSANDCAQAYSSYDPQSGTYIGDDGIAHSCP
jgi:BA14K-like protein